MFYSQNWYDENTRAGIVSLLSTTEHHTLVLSFILLLFYSINFSQIGFEIIINGNYILTQVSGFKNCLFDKKRAENMWIFLWQVITCASNPITTSTKWTDVMEVIRKKNEKVNTQYTHTQCEFVQGKSVSRLLQKNLCTA